MSESAHASVLAFAIPGPEDARPVLNPAERLHLAEAMRMAEAIVFASAEPVSEKQLAARLPEGIDVTGVVMEAGRATTVKTRVLASHLFPQQLARIDRLDRRPMAPAVSSWGLIRRTTRTRGSGSPPRGATRAAAFAST